MLRLNKRGLCDTERVRVARGWRKKKFYFADSSSNHSERIPVENEFKISATDFK